MSDTRKLLGDKGEAIAAEYLEKLGYRIIAKNYRKALGEIDLLAQINDTSVIVEVKSRRSILY